MKSPHPRTKLICLLAAACLALAPAALAVAPPPDGGYLGENTAEGNDALFSNTGVGMGNTALGFDALYADTTGGGNTATGWHALGANTTGSTNTATGTAALLNNTTGYSNTASGHSALITNTTGFANTANGVDCLFVNTTGNYNTGMGDQALLNNATGSYNAAVGFSALLANEGGSNNVALGFEALGNSKKGSSNIAVGASAGAAITGSNDIAIGNTGQKVESGVIRIGNPKQVSTYIAGISGVTVAGGVGVIVDANGHLGTVTSSARYKEAIKPMQNASEAILALQPVTFHYKKELDPKVIPQFGLVAEQVEKVDPDLVARDEEGKPYAVRYEAVNAMLLNEFLKEHRKVEAQATQIGQLEATVAKLRSELEKQAAQLQRVNERLDSIPPAPRLVENR